MPINPSNNLKKSEEMFDFSIRSAIKATSIMPRNTGIHTMDSKKARYSLVSQKMTKMIPSSKMSSL